jgi:hypothetical protein
MGLFKKKNNKEEGKMDISSVPELPEFPKLPELPSMKEFYHEEDSLPQLPKFPNNSLGNKFSQNTIKDAIAGKKEDEEVSDAEDFPEEDMGMMQRPLPMPLQRRTIEESEDTEDYQMGVQTKYKTKEVPQNFVSKNYSTRKAEPIFIRLDKFEESMKVFQEIKLQISDIENLIKNTKDIKSKEDEELASWETEIQKIKNQIEKVNQDIFSRIE